MARCEPLPLPYSVSVFVSSRGLVKWSTTVALCFLLLSVQQSLVAEGRRADGEIIDESLYSHHDTKRQDSPLTTNDFTLSTSPEENGRQSFLDALGSYWYVLLVILVVLVVVFVFLCACIVRRRRRNNHSLMEMGNYSKSPESTHSARHHNSTDTHSAHPHTNSSVVDLASSPGSLSIDPTPIPSPQPSFASSSQRSHRSSGHKRRRNPSPGHTSSGSEETIKAYETRSVSSLGLGHSTHGYPRIPRAESVNGGERRRSHSSRSHHRGHRRTTSNPQVKVTPIPDNGSLYSSPSVVSVMSVGSNRSNRSSKSNRSSRSNKSSRSNRSHSDSSSTVVEVDVKVHLTKEQECEARNEIVAALAESARQLAQSAANFGQETDDPMWYSHSLPYHSSTSPPHRVALNTTHSLPTAMYSKRQLFPSHSSSALPSRGDVNGGSRPAVPKALPTASLDRPRNTASLDRPPPAYYERSRRDSNGRRSQPESPLTFSLSSPSQKSLSSNYEFAPGNSNNYPGAQVHLLSRPPHYLRSYSHSGVVQGGGPGIETANSAHSQVSLDYVQNPQHSEQYFQYQNGYYPPPPPSHEPATASLDFRSSKTKPPLNGMTSPASYPSNLPSRLEEIHSRLLDSGLRTEHTTGTDSNSSTLRSSSHSSTTNTAENKDRLSRLSEKSEQVDSETDGEPTTTTYTENGVSTTHTNGGRSRLSSADRQAGRGVSNGEEDVRLPLTKMPTHVQHTTTSSKSRKPKHKHSRSDIPVPNPILISDSDTTRSSPTTIVGDTYLHETLSSTASSHSTPPNTNDRAAFKKHSAMPIAPPTLINEGSTADVSIQPDNPEGSQTSMTQSLPADHSSSGLSIEDDEEEEGQVSSIASGYAATGSASSLDTPARESASGPPAAVSELNQKLESQFSYPLEKLLGQSLSYDLEDDENFAVLDQPLMMAPVGQHRHRNEQRHHRNKYHRPGNEDYQFSSRPIYHSDDSRGNVPRGVSGSSYMNGTAENHHLGYGSPPKADRTRYSHSHHESITIDV